MQCDVVVSAMVTYIVQYELSKNSVVFLKVEYVANTKMK